MSEFIETSLDAGVMTVRLRRPEKKNAIDRPMYRALANAFAAADADPAIAATLLCGVPGIFTAGNDIRDFIAFAMSGAMSGDAGSVAGDDIRSSEVGAFLYALATTTKPLVAAVDGLAIGVGTTLLMHCDLVFASPGSIFRTPFLDLGLVPEAASSLIAPKLMGHQRAFALLALGETFSAEEALSANLVYRLAPSGEVEAMALAAARALAAKPPEALAIARDLIRGPRDAVLERIALEMRHFAQRLTSREASAAFQAFMTR